MRGLARRVAVITGAAGGIGTAVCRRLIAEDVRVAALDLNKEGLARLSKELDVNSKSFLALELDITDFAAVTVAAQTIQSHFGQIDILINNAGWDLPKQFLDSEPEFWSKVISINLVGALNMHRAILPHIISNGGGKVVNVASDAARVGSSWRIGLRRMQGRAHFIYENASSGVCSAECQT